MKRTTRTWVRKAESDYGLAVLIAHGHKPFRDELCFHCQQSAEKYLKALWEELGQTVPKTHDLIALLNLLLPYHRRLFRLRRGLGFLTDFAVDIRYPGDNATKRQAISALRWAGQVRDACRTLLGLRPPRPRRRRSP